MQIHLKLEPLEIRLIEQTESWNLLVEPLSPWKKYPLPTTQQPKVSGKTSSSHHRPSSQYLYYYYSRRGLSAQLVNPTGRDSLWTLITAAFCALNSSNSNITRSCWLCFGTQLPYYEAVGLLNATYSAFTYFDIWYLTHWYLIYMGILNRLMNFTKGHIILLKWWFCDSNTTP